MNDELESLEKVCIELLKKEEPSEEETEEIIALLEVISNRKKELEEELEKDINRLKEYLAESFSEDPMSNEAECFEWVERKEELEKLEARKKWFQEKQENKKSYYEDQAEKNKQMSSECFNHSDKLVKNIPAGQPILVGHHSEKRHRKLLERSQNAGFKGLELSKKAEYYEEKAKSVGQAGIMSDDPEAIKKLKETIAELEEKRTAIKEHNKKSRRGEIKEKVYEPWLLSNLGQNIKAKRDRLKALEAVEEKIKDKKYSEEGFEIEISSFDRRIKIWFDTKPNINTREKIKQHGFHWSRYESCWMKKITHQNHIHPIRIGEYIKDIKENI